MYFDFEDHRPDTPLLDRPLTRLEQILLTIIAYLLIVIGLIVYPKLPFVKAAEAARLQKLEEERKRQELKPEPMMYAFAMPKVQIPRVPERPKVLSDESHKAQSPEKAPVPKNAEPFNQRLAEPLPSSPAPREETRPAGEQPTAPAPSNPNALALPTTPDATIVRNEPRQNPLSNRAPGLLSDAIKNVQKYSGGATLQNLEGQGDSGPSFQFDSKGVDFGSWLRRFRAQVYRNWLVPYAAMSMRGHTVLRFTIHRDGAITDLIILQPSTVDAFTRAAFNAIKTSNPTVPLPEAYPDESMVMTVIFYYNELPPGGGGL